MNVSIPYAGVICRGHGDPFPDCGKVDIDAKEYERQMMRPDSTWRCPECGAEAWFDDERFEELHPQPEGGYDREDQA